MALVLTKIKEAVLRGLLGFRIKRYGRSKAWINDVARDGHNLTSKINRHEKSQAHTNAAAVYGSWKSCDTIDEESERIAKNNIYFW